MNLAYVQDICFNSQFANWITANSLVACRIVLCSFEDGMQGQIESQNSDEVLEDMLLVEISVIRGLTGLDSRLRGNDRISDGVTE